MFCADAEDEKKTITDTQKQPEYRFNVRFNQGQYISNVSIHQSFDTISLIEQINILAQHFYNVCA